MNNYPPLKFWTVALAFAGFNLWSISSLWKSQQLQMKWMEDRINSNEKHQEDINTLVSKRLQEMSDFHTWWNRNQKDL